MYEPLAPLPTFNALAKSPELVSVLDKVRFGPLSDDYEYGEFLWFIREYPRVYRHHYDHAGHRLSAIHQAYQDHHTSAEALIRRNFDHPTREGGTLQEYSYSNRDVSPIYWDFESYLQAISSALDIVARVVGTAFKQDTPPNFNRFCKKAPDSELKDVFVRAQYRWVKRMKAYRDCFIHFTSIDTLLTVQIKRYSGVWQLRTKLPINPEARDIISFRYSRRVELLRYATTVWKHLAAFDRSVAKVLWRLYKQGSYPQKTSGLFFLGRGVSS
ncbi:MAG: hypothetical protein H0U23_11545 [Blastocatellia bacterium]|nr:hypothetical protein [Blastocatellia bacterium]